MIRQWTPARALRLAPLAGPGPVTALLVLNTAVGVLPIVFVVASSRLLGAVPQVADAGWNASTQRLLVTNFAVAVGALLLREALTPLRDAVGELLARRIDGVLIDDLMAAALGTDDLVPLTDPRVTDALRTAVRELEEGVRSPGQAAAGAFALLARVVEWLGYCLAVAVLFAWWAGLVLGAVVLLFRRAQRRGLRRYAEARAALDGAERRVDYLRRLSVEPGAGPEIRVFGLRGWLWDELGAAYRAWLTPVWAARRKAYLGPFYLVTAVGVVAVGGVLAGLGATASGALSLTGFFLVTQATLGAVRLGEFYPETDLQVTVGMRAYDAVRRFRTEVAKVPDRPRTGGATVTPRIPDPAQSRVPDPRDGIHFDQVTFRYPGRREAVLDRLDLTLAAGQCTAIVGANGAGKSTIVKLLARLHAPDQGAVRLDGTDIADYPLDAWRRKLAVIFQDFARYEVSATDNIGFGAVRAIDDQSGIRAAAEAAGIAADLDRLPGGPDAPLARHIGGGVQLSGGQWQRIALARAVFALRHGCPILVLDEPTASLDVRSEARFFDEFTDLVGGATTVLISHRFSTVRRADHIVVLDGGRVAEQGSHAQLLAQQGRYAGMFRLQAARFGQVRA
ncbi:ABC transporter ATP-binding protein [Micromonospora yangpuensis]|uniref:ATP-binding cassette, subfamily B n=1 Tax=Micromonospora yangpuensis TaxID=683228 RepID=A0A1C6TXK3_9ACTN|nr:ATP-binding cassette domain-containing protein [Micromonospora yangpuensis]GGM01871.1 multidrug ABC transporter permease [Micromonospora yangpuensis]SCL46383.1 ATP-binding cassette, subfamily B [Micromonospora yangpuensis]